MTGLGAILTALRPFTGAPCVLEWGPLCETWAPYRRALRHLGYTDPCFGLAGLLIWPRAWVSRGGDACSGGRL